MRATNNNPIGTVRMVQAGAVILRRTAVLGGMWAALGGAGAGGPREQPAAHLVAARRDDPEASLADLQRGRITYSRRCGSCHALREPGSVAPEAWGGMVEKMRKTEGVH